MNWLDKSLNLSKYYIYDVGKYNILVSDEKVKWTRVPKEITELLIRFDGRTLKDIYIESRKLKQEYKINILVLLKFFVSEGVSEQLCNYKDKTVFFLVTKRCNLKCLTCYVSDNECNTNEELTLTEIDIIFKKLSFMGYNLITLSGGEPLLREDIREIIILAKKYFREVNLNSNGILLDIEIAEFLKCHDINIMVSLESFNSEINNEIRGRGIYEKVMDTLKYLKKIGHGSSTTISMTLTNLNISEVTKMWDFCMEEGFNTHYGIFVESGRGRCNSEYLDVKIEDQIDVYFHLLRENAERREDIEECLDIPRCLTKCATYCGAINSILNIMPNGDIYPCPNLIEPVWKMGNIREQKIADIISESPVTKQITARDVRNVTECKDCSIRFVCGGGCMANAYLKKDDIYEKDPLCDFYKAILLKQLENWDLGKSSKENILYITKGTQL